MKELKKYTKELKSCSMCGLCQAVCPIYKITKNDCTSPRGKILLLNNLLNSNNTPSKNLKKYMDLCTNCGKCYEYCPIKIDMVKINKAFYKDFPDCKKYIPNNFAIFHPIMYLKLIKNKYLQN